MPNETKNNQIEQGLELENIHNPEQVKAEHPDLETVLREHGSESSEADKVREEIELSEAQESVKAEPVTVETPPEQPLTEQALLHRKNLENIINHLDGLTTDSGKTHNVQDSAIKYKKETGPEQLA